MVLFIMLYKVVLTLSLWTKYSTVTIQMKAIRAVLSCAAVYYAVQGDSVFGSVYKILKCDHSNESY